MGLRETKKTKVHDAILNAARELFFTLGYRSTAIEAIADRAGVAVGTVYNYFESKSAVLLAITAKDTAAALSGQSGLPHRASGLEILREYLNTFMESLSRYPEKLLGELVRKTFGATGAPSGGNIPDDRPTLLHGLESLIGRLAREGKLREDLDVRVASLVVYGIVMTTLMKYAEDRRMTADRMMDSLDEMLEAAYIGLGPKGGVS
ncbi:MAG: helix-turn-helix domain-containing protein [Candidatus Aegiribacteria sp.]